MYTLRTLYPMFHCILCICHGLRLSNLNKETTYLLTYLLLYYQLLGVVRSPEDIYIPQEGYVMPGVCLSVC